MQTQIQRAMILGAGLGTRLLPITQEVPKPLVSILTIPNILYSIFLLRNAGIREIVINLFHLGPQIQKFLGNGEAWGVSLSHLKEEVLLGTGGGVKNAEVFFQNEPFVLINCDFISDLNLNSHIEKHFSRRALATMILYQNPKIANLYSFVGITKEEHLCHLPRFYNGTPTKSGIFTGVHILHPSVLSFLEKIPCGINDKLYPQLMKAHPTQIFGDFAQASFWYDTGELETLWLTSMKLLERLFSPSSPVAPSSSEKEVWLKTFLKEIGQLEEKQPGVWVHPSTVLPSDIKVSAPVILGKECILGKRLEIGPFAVVGDSSEIRDEAKLSHSVLIDHALVLPNQILENTIQYKGNSLCNSLFATRKKE